MQTHHPKSVERINVMSKVESYDDYLKSEHWISFRTEYYRVHARCCIVCYDEHRLNLHHRYYSIGGVSILNRETFSDVCVLCERCHGLLHKKKLERLLSHAHYRRRKSLVKLRSELGLTVHHRNSGISEIKARHGAESRAKKREAQKKKPELRSVRSLYGGKIRDRKKSDYPTVPIAPLWAGRNKPPARLGGLTVEKIESVRTQKGGYTRKQLEEWGVEWPPKKGWKRELEKKIGSVA